MISTDRSPPLLPLRQSDLNLSSSNLELMQTLEHEEILQRFTGYNKQRTKTRGKVLSIMTIILVVFGLGSLVFVLGEQYSNGQANGGATHDEHNLNHTNSIVFIPPFSSSFVEPEPINNKITTIRPTITSTKSSDVNKSTAAAAEINNNGPTTKATNPNFTGISNNGTSSNTNSQYTTSKPDDPQISVINNLTQSPTKGPKIPKDIVAENPTSFLHIVAGQHIKHWHLEYSEKPCVNGNRVVGHKAICEFRDQKFTGYASKKKIAKTIASRKAVEHFYDVKYPEGSQWLIPEDESFSTYC